MSKAANKVRSMLAVQLGPNVPTGASRQFVNLVKAIGAAGSNHVSKLFIFLATSAFTNLCLKFKTYYITSRMC